MRQWNWYVPGLAVTCTANGPAGGPAKDTPLLTTEVPSKVHGGSGALPHPNGTGSAAGTKNCECVVPLGFVPPSSVSVLNRLAACSSAVAVTPAGNKVAVWKPSIANWIVAPVGTEIVRGKKSLKPQFRPAGTADGMSAVIVNGAELASAWACPIRGAARASPASKDVHLGIPMANLQARSDHGRRVGRDLAVAERVDQALPRSTGHTNDRLGLLGWRSVVYGDSGSMRAGRGAKANHPYRNSPGDDTSARPMDSGDGSSPERSWRPR